MRAATTPTAAHAHPVHIVRGRGQFTVALVDATGKQPEAYEGNNAITIEEHEMIHNRVHVISEDQARRFNQAALNVLQRVGMRVLSDKLLGLCEDHGRLVDHTQGVVRFQPEKGAGGTNPGEVEQGAWGRREWDHQQPGRAQPVLLSLAGPHGHKLPCTPCCAHLPPPLQRRQHGFSQQHSRHSCVGMHLPGVRLLRQGRRRRQMRR